MHPLRFFALIFKLPNKEKPLADHGRNRISLITIIAFNIRSYLDRHKISAGIQALKYHSPSSATTSRNHLGNVLSGVKHAFT